MLSSEKEKLPGYMRYIEKEKIDRGKKNVGKKGGQDYVDGFYRKYFSSDKIEKDKCPKNIFKALEFIKAESTIATND